MAFYQWHPARNFQTVQREMNRLFEDFFDSQSVENENVKSNWSPKVDIFDQGDDIVFIAELPGVSKENMKLSVNQGVLALSGEKPAPVLGDNECVHCAERFFGPFERKFTLPSNVDASKINADFQNGVLNIKLPKAEEAKPKEIQIQAE